MRKILFTSPEFQIEESGTTVSVGVRDKNGYATTTWITGERAERVKAAIAAIEAPDDNDDPDENLNAFDNLECAIGAAFKYEAHLYDAIWP